MARLPEGGWGRVPVRDVEPALFGYPESCVPDDAAPLLRREEDVGATGASGTQVWSAGPTAWQPWQ